MNTKALEKIGLTKSEIKVYLALLKLGQSTAGPIVNEAKVTRSKVYDILERLKNKGLVGYITKDATKYFSAADPKTIINYLEEKEKEIQEDKKSIEHILPELLKQQALSKKGKIAEIFIGMKGMQSAFNIFINEFEANTPYYALGAGKGEDTKQIQLFFSRFHKERVKKKVKSKIIFNESSRGLFKSQEKSKYTEVRYLMSSTPTGINIYKDYSIIAILNKEPITFLIKNKETADSFREYFKVMWKQAKK